VRDLTVPLVEEHEVPKQVVTQVLSWFGDVHAEIWSMDVDAVLKEIGLGILREHKVFSFPFLVFLNA
jgi:sister chromatid cohesion protein DCC1